MGVRAKRLVEHLIDPQCLRQITGESGTYELSDVDLPSYRDTSQDATRDAEAEEANLEAASKSPFTAWEYADRVGRHDPRLQQAVTGSVYEPHYREKFYSDKTGKFDKPVQRRAAPMRKPAPARAPQQQQPAATPARTGIRGFFDRFRRR
jgi:hypothetical protein